jgi:head-tail adaptor
LIKQMEKLRIHHMNHFFDPTIWINGPDMYATCKYLNGKSFVDTSRKARMTFENRLWRKLRSDWGVIAQTLRLKYHKGYVDIIFLDDDEFIMAKISNHAQI